MDSLPADDYHCGVCHKWLDKHPWSCEKRVCGLCYPKVSGPRCPVCNESIGDGNHFGQDWAAVKDMKRTGTCKVCGASMLMVDLRDHEDGHSMTECEEVLPPSMESQEIWEPAEGGCVGHQQDQAVDMGPEERGEMMDDDGERHPPAMEPPQIPPQKIPVQELMTCPYKKWGCLFQGSEQELQQHIQARPRHCTQAQQLQLTAEILHQRLLQKRALIQEISQLMEAELVQVAREP